MLIGALVMSIGIRQASRRLHAKLLRSILRAPLKWFETTPCGRIMNRCSADIQQMDEEIIKSFRYFLTIVAEAIKLFATTFAAFPLLAPIVVPLILLIVFVSRFYNCATAQFRRIRSTKMSRVLSAVHDAYAGASTIRAFGELQRFSGEFCARLDETVEASIVEIACAGWMQVCLEWEE